MVECDHVGLKAKDMPKNNKSTSPNKSQKAGAKSHDQAPPLVAPRIVPPDQLSVNREKIDRDAIRTVRQLHRFGHTAYIVGGSVRDLILGRTPKDFDIVTSARPAQVRLLFRNCRLIGRRFRLAHIHFLNGKVLELATFRAQPDLGDQDDGLLLKDNTFGTPRLDALRRDFTVNSLFYDIATSSVVDYVGGLADIQAGLIRTIGQPDLRFQEDPVRMIRAIRFSARLGFDIEKATRKSIEKQGELISRSPIPRVTEEWARLLEEGASSKAIGLLYDLGLLDHLDKVQARLVAQQLRANEEGDPLLFALLAEVDHIREEGLKLSRPLLYAVWLLPLLLLELDFVESERDPAAILRQSFQSIFAHLNISRRESEETEEILLLFRRLIEKKKRKRTGKPLQQRHLFKEALLVLEIYSFASGQYDKELRHWHELVPKVDKPTAKPVAVETPHEANPKQRRLWRRRNR